MEIKPQTTRNLQISGSIIAAILIGFGVYQYVSDSQIPATPKTEPEITTTPKSDASDSSNLTPLPTNLPIESGAELKSDFGPGGNIPVTYAYTSTQSLSTTYNSYKTYFEKNGWSIENTENKSTFKMLYAVKDGSSLLVSMAEEKNVKTVAITRGKIKTP